MKRENQSQNLMWQLLESRLIRFGLVGGTGVIVNYGCYVFFHEALGLYYLLANVLAIEVSLISNFILNERWTFQDRKRSGWQSYCKRMLAFNFSSGLVAWFTQTPILFVLTHFFHVWDKLAVMIGICIGALANYFVSNYFIFKPKAKASTDR